MKKERTSGTGKGLISPGGDKNSYLGHFRNANVLKRGHNQGAPQPGVAPMQPTGVSPMAPAAVQPAPRQPAAAQPPTSHPSLNPISNPGGFAAAGGTASPVLGGGRARAMYNPATNPIRATRQAERAAGTLGTKAGRAGLKMARAQAKTMPKAERKAAGQAARQEARGERQSATQAARGTLQEAVGGVRQARQALRGAIRGQRVARRGVRAARSV